MRYPVLQARRGLLLSSHDIFVTHKRTIVAVVRHLKSSSLSRSFCSQPANAVGGEEVFHRRGNFYDVCLERENVRHREICAARRQSATADSLTSVAMIS